MFGPGARLVELFDKDSNRIVMTNSNQIIIYTDVPFYWDAWDIEYYYKDTPNLIESASQP